MFASPTISHIFENSWLLFKLKFSFTAFVHRKVFSRSLQYKPEKVLLPIELRKGSFAFFPFFKPPNPATHPVWVNSKAARKQKNTFSDLKISSLWAKLLIARSKPGNSFWLPSRPFSKVFSVNLQSHPLTSSRNLLLRLEGHIWMDEALSHSKKLCITLSGIDLFREGVRGYGDIVISILKI